MLSIGLYEWLYRRFTMSWRIQQALRLLRLEITGALRVLPDFLLVGAPKCGTTSLYGYLAEHPNVLPAMDKEVRFFDQFCHRSLSWYRGHFPMRRELRRAERETGQRVLTGEATPTYLMSPVAPGRAHAVVPEAKLIALLRNPIDRAYSNYQMEVRHGTETLSFEEALDAEEERLKDERIEVYEDGARFKFTDLHFSYQKQGIYVEQLKRWLEYYHRDQLLVLDSELLFENPAECYARVLDFLGLPPHEPDSFPVLYQGIYKDTMRPKTRKRLLEYYQPHNEELFELLGERFEWGE